MHKHLPLLSCPLLLAACGTSPAPVGLDYTLARRLDGDRTGACLAVAVIGEKTERAIHCANSGAEGALDFGTAFEVGSISKAMTGILLADAERRGELRLDAPLGDYLPADAHVPELDGVQITLRDLATHTAGLPALPARLESPDPADPYATLSEAVLLASLDDMVLTAPPGEHWAYSNYGFMLLSKVLAQATGRDVSTLLEERLFRPLGMRAFVGPAPSDITLAQGHTSTGATTAHWTFPPALSGFGGVRASLDDMILLAQAALAREDSPLSDAIFEATQPQRTPTDGPVMGLGWLLLGPKGQELAFHDGGTGGFSSVIGVDRVRKRAVVVLSDTSWVNFEGINDLGLHLLDPQQFALPKPRRTEVPPRSLVKALAGRYAVDGLEVELAERAGTLTAALDGAELVFAYDSYGDFYPSEIDALVSPVRNEDGTFTFDRKQGGAVVRAVRKP